MTDDQLFEMVVATGVPPAVGLVLLLIGWRPWRGLRGVGGGASDGDGDGGGDGRRGERLVGGWVASVAVGVSLLFVYVFATWGGFGAFADDSFGLSGRMDVKARVLWAVAGAGVVGVVLTWLGPWVERRVPGVVVGVFGPVLRFGVAAGLLAPIVWRNVGREFVGYGRDEAFVILSIAAGVVALAWTALSEVQRWGPRLLGPAVGVVMAGMAAPVLTLAGGGALQSAGYAAGAIAGVMSVVFVVGLVLRGRAVGAGWTAVASLGVGALLLRTQLYGQLEVHLSALVMGSAVAAGLAVLPVAASLKRGERAGRMWAVCVLAVLYAALTAGVAVVLVVANTDFAGYGVETPSW